MCPFPRSVPRKARPCARQACCHLHAEGGHVDSSWLWGSLRRFALTLGCAVSRGNLRPLTPLRDPMGSGPPFSASLLRFPPVTQQRFPSTLVGTTLTGHFGVLARPPFGDSLLHPASCRAWRLRKHTAVPLTGVVLGPRELPLPTLQFL